MQRVAGESAASPAVPARRPTNALSIFDKRGELKDIPRAGTAKVSILRFDAWGRLLFLYVVAISLELSLELGEVFSSFSWKSFDLKPTLLCLRAPTYWEWNRSILNGPLYCEICWFWDALNAWGAVENAETLCLAQKATGSPKMMNAFFVDGFGCVELEVSHTDRQDNIFISWIWQNLPT